MAPLAEWIDTRQAEMLALLEKLVNTDSGSFDKAGVDRVGDMLGQRLTDLGFAVERSAQERFGNHVIARKPGSGDQRILFIGHMDTVFPAGTAAKRPFRIEGGQAYGPGVADMKGGIVGLLYALAAVKAAAPQTYLRLAMDVVFNSDEEVLSPTSRPIIERLAQEAHLVCVFEPARPGGEYVVQRKGVGKYTLQITGRASHAGAQPEQGRSAIGELAHKVVALHALTDFTTGTTVNVGVIRGGERPNVIAENAYAEIDLRVPDAETAERIDRRIKAIAANATVPDTVCELSGGLQFPPMLPSLQSQRVFGALQDIGKRLGLDLRGIATGGGSDGNHAARFAPTLDGMGPRGSGAHSDREFMDIPSLAERCKVTALFLEAWPEVADSL